MLARVIGAAVVGVDGLMVQVEVDLAQGLPSFSTVGLAEGAVREAKDRVRAAIRNSGYEFPPRRITVTLSVTAMISRSLWVIRMIVFPSAFRPRRMRNR